MFFWTSRGQVCRPFSRPVRAFTFIAHNVQHSYCSSIFIELLTHALALCAIKGPRRPYNNPILRMFLFSSSWKYSGVCLFRRSYAINRIMVAWATQLTFGARASRDTGLRQRRESVGTYVVAIVAKAQCYTTSVARELVRFFKLTSRWSDMFGVLF